MEPGILKIKCPCCGAVLALRQQPDMESRSLTCPNCKMKMPFVQFKVVADEPRKDDAETCLPGMGTNHASRSSGEDNMQIGSLIMHPQMLRFPLAMGNNVVGRKSSSVTVEVALPTNNMMVSRRHAKIEVRYTPGVGVMHTISNAENKNPTYVNKKLLQNGDIVILKSGDQIMMADLLLTFEIPN